MTAVEEWVNGKDHDFFSFGLLALDQSWSKCVTLEGNYIEKNRGGSQREISQAGYLLTRPRISTLAFQSVIEKKVSFQFTLLVDPRKMI